MKIFNTLFGSSELIKPKQYFVWGISLMLFKYVIDLLAVYIAQKHFITPYEFFSPYFIARKEAYAPEGQAMWPLVLTYIMSLLMLWIGLSMTFRRVIDAGRPWLGFFFFIPYVNLALMLALSIMPSRPIIEKDQSGEMKAQHTSQKIFIAMFVIALFAVISVAAIVFSIKAYGGVLFAGLPFITGIILGYYVNSQGLLTKRRTIFLTLGTFVICAGMIFLLAIEGLICLIMAAPIILFMGVLGSMIGRRYSRTYPNINRLSLVAVLPTLMIFSAIENQVSPVLMGEVKSSIVINASTSDVWKNVVVFPELQPPTELMFKAGISYPIRARIEGTGVGAIRYCEFNSGAFIEPITVWEENKRLSFDVAFQPKPMTEMSLWDEIEAPHIDGFFKSKRGEFRLIEMGNGKTLLEGSTWYALDIFPSPYWRLYSEWIVHKIHLRVLNHIKINAEKKQVTPAT